MSEETKSGKPSASVRELPSGIWTLGFVSLLMDVSSEMIHALLPVYLVTVLGVSTLTVGFIEGVAEATANITKVFSGALSDWLGRRKLLTVLGYGLAALTKPIFPLAPDATWIVGARFVDRIGKGIREAPRDALIADLTPQALRGAGFGLRQSLDTVGAVVGPLIAILLMWITANHFQTVFWVAVIPAVFAVALLILGLKEPDRPMTAKLVPLSLSLGSVRKLGASYWMVVALGAVFALARFSEAFLILKARDAGLPLVLVPGVLIVMNIVYAAGAYPAGVLSDRGNRSKLLMFGLLFLIGADLFLGFSAGMPGIVLGVMLWGLHLAFTQGVLSAMVADVSPDELRGTAYGLFSLSTGLSLLAASVLAGAVWDGYGPAMTFQVRACFAGAALAGLVLTRRIISPVEQEAVEQP
jgi:MFS family permease